MSNDQKLKDKILELQNELAIKEIENAKFRNELVRVNEALEKISAQMSQEIKLASALQKILTPTEIPNISGVDFSSKFIPGTEMGGDFFDIFEHEDKMRFGILLSSCTGYSLSAVLIGVLIKLSSRIEARRSLDPDKVLSLMVGEVAPQIVTKDKASLFYAVIDRRNFEMKYSSIGQICGYLQTSEAERVSLLEPSAGYLSKDFSETPLIHSITLGARDRLVLCTEGITLASNENRQSFGREGVLKSIQRSPKQGVHELRNEILFQVEQFSKKPEPIRDQTVIVTEVKDRVIKLAKKSST